MTMANAERKYSLDVSSLSHKQVDDIRRLSSMSKKLYSMNKKPQVSFNNVEKAPVKKPLKKKRPQKNPDDSSQDGSAATPKINNCTGAKDDEMSFDGSTITTKVNNCLEKEAEIKRFEPDKKIHQIVEIKSVIARSFNATLNRTRGDDARSCDSSAVADETKSHGSSVTGDDARSNASSAYADDAKSTASVSTAGDDSKSHCSTSSTPNLRRELRRKDDGSCHSQSNRAAPRSNTRKPRKQAPNPKERNEGKSANNLSFFLSQFSLHNEVEINTPPTNSRGMSRDAQRAASRYRSINNKEKASATSSAATERRPSRDLQKQTERRLSRDISVNSDIIHLRNQTRALHSKRITKEWEFGNNEVKRASFASMQDSNISRRVSRDLSIRSDATPRTRPRAVNTRRVDFLVKY